MNRRSQANLTAAGISAAAFAAMMLTGTAALADHPAGKGGTLNFGINSRMAGFDLSQVPQIRVYGNAIMRASFEDLFSLDKDGKLVPELGLSVESSDNSKVWRVKLRKGVRYANGEPFNAQTYVYGVKRYQQSRVAGFVIGRTAPFKEVVAINDNTVEFRLRTPFIGFKDLISNPISYMWFNAPKHAQTVGKDLLRRPVGTGPYMLADWKPDNSLTYVRNPNYWDPKRQHLDKIVFKVIRGNLPLLNSMRSGQLDMYIGRDAKTSAQARKLKGFKVQKHFAGGAGEVALKLTHPALKDLRVRRALAHAIDRATVEKVATGGAGVPASDWWGPQSKWHCKNTGYPKYNPEKAKQLLKEYGKPVKFTLLSESTGNRSRIAQAHQTFWKRVGVDVTLDLLPRGPAYVQKYRKGQFEAVIVGIQARTDPSRVHRVLHSKHKNNVMKSNFPELDKALDDADKVTDPSKRKEAYCNYTRTAVKYLPNLLISHTPFYVVHRDYVKAIGGTVNNITSFQNAYLDGKK